MDRKSFAEILAGVKAENPNPRVQDFTNWEPQSLRDQSGHELRPLGSITPADARQLVLEGAVLAWDGCGCGDYPPAWIDPRVARTAADRGKPTLEQGNACRTHLDLWTDDCGDLVCMHGDVAWGFAYPTAPS